MTTDVRIVADFACHTGEGPVWHPDERRLYWTDIPAGRLFTLDPATGDSRQVYSGRPVGAFTLQADGALALFMDRGTVAIWRDGHIERTVLADIPEERDTRFNDVIADPEGRVFCGTMSLKGADNQLTKPSKLYRLDPGGRLSVLLDGIATSNGLGFSRDLRTLYYAETRARVVWQFDYDRATGQIANRREFVRVPTLPSGERPDGLTVDSAGNVYVALWDGGAVVCYAPDGRLLRRIALPCPKVSSVALGGDDYRTLFITTVIIESTAVSDSSPARLIY
jgi:D-xylonolactonase